MQRAFRVEALGLTELPKPPVLAARGGCWSGTGAVRLHLGIEEDFRPARKAHPGLRVTDIDAWAARLRGHGARFEWDDDLPGYRRFHSQDPVGNRLEFGAGHRLSVTARRAPPRRRPGRRGRARRS